MFRDIFPFVFEIERLTIAASCLWSLALYLAASKVKDWITDQFQRWLNFADRSLYTSVEEFEETRIARESQNALYASVVSIVPFLVLGAFSHWGLDASLGINWSIGLALAVCFYGVFFNLIQAK